MGDSIPATLTVRDNGHGIKDLENLFEPFYTTKKPGEGVGLGLAICAVIVQNHHGRVRLAVRDHGRTEFRFSIPYDASKDP